MSLLITRPSIPVPLPLTRGGTEATTPAGARATLELGDLATLTAPGGTTTFLRADTSWAVPPGGGGGGVSTFLELTDAPDTYTGQGGLSVRVNALATALEFAALPAASETAAGVVELATTAEVQAGTDTTRAVTPAGLAAKLPLTTKGDLLVRDASALTRVPVGTDGQVLTADAAQALGVRWATPAGGNGDSYWSRVDLGASTLLDGLVAYWQLDEATGNRADSVGTNHLVPTGGPPNISNAAGKIGQALAMDGTAGTFLSVPDNAALSAGPNQSFTLACWVYLTGTGNMGIVGKGSVAVDSKNCAYMLWHYNGLYHFLVGDGSTFVNLPSTFTPVLGTWTLLVAWYDATADTQNIQVNNGAVTSVANTAGSYDSGLPFEVGRTVGFASQSLAGRADLLYVTKRVPTVGEREQLWNNGTGFAYPFLAPSRLSPATLGDQVLLAATPLTTERLEVDGALKLGNALGTVDGTLRWTGADFEGRKAGAWASLTGPPLPLAITDGGTGATTAPAARTALGLGTLAVQDASAVAITGGSVVIADRAGDNVVAFRSQVTTGGTNRWNTYSEGTAPNFWAGQVGLGTPPGAGLQLHVSGPTQLGGRTGLNGGVGSNVACVIWHDKNSLTGLHLQPTGTDTGAAAVVFANIVGAVVGTITTTGSATAYNTSSDARLKHATSPLTGSLDTVRALRPVAFRWQADGSKGHGFLAHELMVHVPEAVSGLPDEVNADGTIKPQQVDHSRLVVWLVGACQELAAQVQALTQRVSTLEEQLGL